MDTRACLRDVGVSGFTWAARQHKTLFSGLTMKPFSRGSAIN